MSFEHSLQPASWRQIPFAVLGTDARMGRRNAIHEYPYRDSIWVEDLGRAARRFQVSGFLVEDSRVYGGGDVLAQRDRIIAAAETNGDGELVHPTYGRMTVSLLNLQVTERWERRRYVEITFDFAEAGARLFPAVETSTAEMAARLASKFDEASLQALIARLRTPVSFGGSVTELIESATSQFASLVPEWIGDATSLFGMGSALPGNFGLYWGGNGLGQTGVTIGISGTFSTIAELVSLGAGARSDVGLAITVLEAAAAGLGVSTLVDYGVAAQALIASMLAAVTDPRDGIRIMSRAVAFSPTDVTGTSPIGLAQATALSAAGDVLRRAAVSAMVRASSAWTPSSYDEAIAARAVIGVVLDAEITVAGDQAEDDAFSSLKALRAAAVLDLTQRSADLARMVTVRTPAPLPALTLAQRLYQDAARAPELVLEARARHPAFMPVEFRALSA